MNCQDIARILDSGKFGALSAGERRDGEAHAHSCRHCAPRWAVHSRLADMPIPPMPQEFAVRCQALVVARAARGNVLRFVRRQTLFLASGFVALAAAAAVVTVRYVAPALQRAEAPAVPRVEPAVVAAVPAPAPVAAVPQPDKTVQQVAQGEPEVDRSTTFAAAIATMGAAVAAEPQTTGERPRTGPAEIIASNDLNKDGIVTREEAAKANGNLNVMWDVYDMDRDGRVDLAEVTRATGEMATGTALQKITGSSGGRLAMRDPKLIVESNDLNKDGIVTREEAAERNGSLNRMWGSYDLNKDGKVDAAEIAKASGY